MPVISNDTINLLFKVRDQTTSGLRSIGSGLANVGRKVADVTTGLVNVTTKAVDGALTLVEKTLNVVETVFDRVGSIVTKIGSIGSSIIAIGKDLIPIVGFLSQFTEIGAALTRATGPFGRLLRVVSAIRNPIFAAVAAMTFFSAASAAFASDINTAAARTTVATEAIQQLNFQVRALASGADLDDLQETLLNISERFGEATKDAGAIRDALNAIGLDQEDIVRLNFEGPEAQLQAIRDSFRDLATDSERIFRARELFAEDGLRTLDFIIAEQQELDRLAQRSVELGLIIPDETLQSISNLSKEYRVFTQVAENSAIEFGAVFAGVSEQSFGLVNDLFGLVGGPRGLGAALSTLTFPIVKPIELALTAARGLVGIFNNLFRVVAQRVVGAIRDAAEATDDWLAELGQSSGIADVFDSGTTALAKTALRVRLAATEFKLLNENLPDTEMQRLVELQVGLQDALAGSAEDARAFSDALVAQNNAVTESNQKIGVLLDQLANVNQQITTDVNVEVTGVEKLQQTQTLLNNIRTGLNAQTLSADDSAAATDLLNQTQALLDSQFAIEADALDRRRAEFSAGFSDIERIQLDAIKRREELNKLFSGTDRSQLEQQQYDRLAAVINSEEQKLLDALKVTRVDKAGEIAAEAARKQEEAQRNAAQSAITTLQESFDEQLRIEGEFNRAAEKLQRDAQTTGLDANAVDDLLLSLNERRLTSLEEYRQRERDLTLQAVEDEKRQIEEVSRLRTEAFEARSAARDLSSLVNVDTTQGIDSGLAEIQRLFLDEVKQINLAPNLPLEERAKLIDDAKALKVAAEAELQINATISTISTGLGIAGNFGDSLSQLSQSSTDSALQRLRESSSLQQDAKEELVAALKSGDEQEVDSARRKLRALSSLSLSEQKIAEKRFKENQKIQRLNTIINTAAGAMAAFNSTPGDIGVKLAAAGAAVAAGAIQLKAINEAKLQTPNSSTGSAGVTDRQLAEAQNNFNNNNQSARPINLTIPDEVQFLPVEFVRNLVERVNQEQLSGNADAFAL